MSEPRKVSAVAATVLAGLGTLFGGAVVATVNGFFGSRLETQRFRTELVLNAVKTGDQKQAQANLRFLVETGLLDDPGGRIAKAAQSEAGVLTLPSQAPEGAPSSSKLDAKDYERRGFQAILAKDLPQALDAFATAEALWPDYHNVREIHQLLESYRPRFERQGLSAPERETLWHEIDKKIIKEYLWGAPAEALQALTQTKGDD